MGKLTDFKSKWDQCKKITLILRNYIDKIFGVRTTIAIVQYVSHRKVVNVEAQFTAVASPLTVGLFHLQLICITVTVYSCRGHV